MKADFGCNAPSPTIEWKDGTFSTGSCVVVNNVNYVDTGAHTYAEAGTYAAVAHYYGQAVPHDAPFTVAIADATLTASARNISATAGAQFTGVVAHLADANPDGSASDFTATINWGDGGSSSGTVQAAAGGYDITASHIYGAAGTDAVTVAIADKGGASASASDTATVAARASIIGPSPGAGTAPPTARFALAPAATNGAPLTLDASSTHGPGTLPIRQYSWQASGANAISAACGAGTSNLKLFLPRSGPQTVTLTVTDTAGRTSQIQQTTPVSGLRYQPKRPVPARAGNVQVPLAWCIPGVNDPPVDVSSNGGPPHGCNQTIDVGIVEAVGCFTQIDHGSDIPANEAAILNQQPQWTASGAHAIDASASRVGTAHAAKFKPTLVGSLSGPALAYFALPFLSHSEVRFNGVDYIPHNGASILIVPALDLIISSDATIALQNIPLANGQIAEDVGHFGVAQRAHVDDYKLSREAARIGVAGLPFDGQIGLDFVFHRAELTASITLPNFFATAGGDPFNATVVLHTDNQSGLELDQIHLGPLNADIFGLGFSDVRFDYNAQGDNWDAQGKLDLFGAVAIDATPDPPNPPEYGVHFRGGEFKSAGAAADFGDSGIEIFPGIQLNRIGVAVSLNPTLFIGDIGLRALELAQIDGRVIVALPSEAAPYQLTTGDAGPQFAQLAGTTFTGSPTIGVGGSLALQIAGINVPLANAYFLYSYPSYVAFGGNFQYGADDFGISGGVNGEFNVAADQFNVEGRVQINLPDPLPGFGGDAVVSSKGIAACGSGYVFPYGHIELGAGYRWGDGIVVWVQTCNIGEFRQQVSTASVRAASTLRTFTLPAGLPSAEVRVDGATDAPSVTVSGPGGQNATTTAATLSVQGAFTLVRTPKIQATWIEINHPQAGTYTISTTPGSAPITALATADGLQPAALSAQVGGSGIHRVLHYRVRPRPGQQVTFLEGSHRIATVTGGGHGIVRFTPAGGALGLRTIVAQITLGGLPNANLTVAHFRVSRLPRLTRVGGLRVRRQGSTLRITWRGLSDATGYAIDVHGSDGLMHSLAVSGSRHSALVRGIARTTAGSAIVTALRARDRGPHARAGFRALARLRTGVHAVRRRR